MHLAEAIDGFIKDGILEHIAVRVGVFDAVLCDEFRGGVNEETRFDMASVTKIMATATLALIALDRGLFSLDDPVSKFYPSDKGITVRNLLTHTMGIGHKPLNISGNTYENIAGKILEIPSDIAVGTDVLYSCPAFILLSKILEKLFGESFDACFDALVASPLGLSHSSFLPKNKENLVNSNVEESLRGTVNDYNCRFLGGVAGNAGLFSSLSDVTKYAKLLLHKGAPLFREKAFSMAVQNYTADLCASRGLGFLYVDKRYTQTAGLFAEGAIGHCGHTGQSVFVDYRSGLYVIILSDATVATVRKYGEERYDAVIDMREKLHAAIKRDLAQRKDLFPKSME